MSDDRTLNVLHLSDLHIQCGSEYEQDLVLNSLAKSLPQIAGKLTTPDLIFLTGDLAFSGLSEQYARATVILTALLESLHLSRDRLFVIPGNHDVDRSRGEFLQRTLSDETESTRYFTEQRRRPHFEKFSAFTEWFDLFFAGLRKWDNTTTCQDPIDVRINDLALSILSVNTALFCHGEADHENLWIGRKSLADAWARLGPIASDLTVVLMHHPIEWLHPDERPVIRSSINCRCNALFRGHLHDPDFRPLAAGGIAAIEFASGAAYQTRRYRNMVSLIRFEPDRQESRITPLIYQDSPHECWTVDPSLFPDRPLFSETIRLSLLDNPSTTPSVVPPSTDRSDNTEKKDIVRLPLFHYGDIVDPPHFIGRRPELAAARAYLEADRNFLLVGYIRDGKTSFCHKLLHEYQSNQSSTRVAAYINAEAFSDMSIATFLRHTALALLSEVSRQVFKARYKDLTVPDKSRVSAHLHRDHAFGALRAVYHSIRSRTYYRRDAAPDILDEREFVELTQDMLKIIGERGFHRFVLFYDEANRLYGGHSHDSDSSLKVTLPAHFAALAHAGVTSICAATPQMVESFEFLKSVFPASVELAEFESIETVKELLAQYYFDDASRGDEVPISTDALERIWAVTNRRPFHIQLVAGNSFGAARASGAKRVNVKHVETAYALLSRERPRDFPPATE